MDTRPLSPMLGVEVRSLDLTLIDDAQFIALREQWNAAHGLLVIRDQNLTPTEQVAFARRFGPLFGEADQFQDSVLKYLLPGQPALYRVSNKKDPQGVALGRERAGNYWHSDVSFRELPAMASLLYAIEVPAYGGDTLFASLTHAYRALSASMKKLLAPLRAVHDFRVAATSSGTYTKDDLIDGDFDGANRYAHPVVIRHPESGQATLFVNPGFTSHLQGFDPAESRAILKFLFQHAVRHEFIYRHRWQPNDLLIWDNRCTMHYAINDYEADRYLHRATVVAEKPVAAASPADLASETATSAKGARPSRPC